MRVFLLMGWVSIAEEDQIDKDKRYNNKRKPN